MSMGYGTIRDYDEECAMQMKSARGWNWSRAPGLQRWLNAHLPRGRALDPLALHPRGASALGIVLVFALVPILGFWHGASGPLGQSIPLFFLVPVLAASALGGRGAGVLVSCVAVFVWDWFFIPPLYRVTVNSVRDVLALVVFLAVALLVGQLSTVARRRTAEALRRAASSEALYDLSMALIAGRNLDEILPALTSRLRAAFDLAACAVLVFDAERAAWRTVALAGQLPPDLRPEESRSLAAIASQVYERGEECRLGRVRRTAGQSERAMVLQPGQERARLLPLRVGARAIGVLELVPREYQKPDREREHLLTTFANGAALAVEQARLAEEERAAAIARESDRFKTALLSSVSHDLRTPLAGIKVATSSLLEPDIEWSEADRQAFLREIDSEVDRLTRLVSDLLDLSRIEAGVVRPTREWVDVGELIDRVARRPSPYLSGHPLLREVADRLPAVRLDAVQLEQVLTNLLENAAKYSPPGTPITIGARTTGGPADAAELEIWVADRGIGIPPEERSKIFNPFYRVPGVVGRGGGTGLGLAIVKGLVEANGGRVEVVSTPGRGSTFSIHLPLDRGTADAAPDSPVPAAGDRRLG
jgi:two-component system sensor histidine kinase KdpD